MGNFIEASSCVIYPHLKSYMQIAEADVLRSHFRDIKCPQILQEDLPARDLIYTRNSLNDFVNEMKGAPINDLARAHLKNGRTLDINFSFQFSTAALFIKDGRFPLSLWAHKDESDVPICVVSFSDLTSLSKARKQPFGRQPLPVIVQLQGRHLEESLGASPARQAQCDITKEVFKNLKWEHLMVELVKIWALKEGFPALYSQPAKLNKYWLDNDEARCQLFKLRYDVTLERMGFRMQPNGLWGTSLIDAA